MRGNIIANFFGKAWSALSVFLFIPAYIHYLGFDNYSIIAFSLVVAGFLIILDLGLTASISRQFARSDLDLAEKYGVYKEMELIYFLIVVGCVAFVFAAADSIAYRWLTIKNHDPGFVSTIIRILGFDVAFQLLLRFYVGGLIGLEKQIVANIHLIVFGTLRSVLVILPIFLTHSLLVFFLWQASVSVIYAIVAKHCLKRQIDAWPAFDTQKVLDPQIMRGVWKFSGGMFLISVVATVNFQMDKLFISSVISVETLGYYTLAVSLGTGLVTIASPILTAIMPRLTALYTARKREAAKALYMKSSRLVAIGVFSIMSVMWLWGKQLLWAWTGDLDIATQASVFLPTLALAYSLLAIGTIPHGVSLANGYTRYNNLIGLTSLLLTVPGYWLIIHRHGALGAAWVFCAVQLLGVVIYMYLVNRRFIGIGVSRLYVETIFGPLICALLASALVHRLIGEEYDNRLLSLALLGVAVTLTIVLSAAIFFAACRLLQMCGKGRFK
jgi:O-antigen/teichoic acid export membrane protein